MLFRSVSFLVATALALAFFVVAPIAAHLLRRGPAREQEFPPAGLVPIAYRSARQKSRLEDRWLLLVRALLIAILSILGAVPFVRCSRLALDREAGASVALALVIDDSLSMRTELGDAETRWDRAIRGARDLLSSTREGDAVSIVLAGEPARLALAATTDLSIVRQTLEQLAPQDRATDLESAIRLAESALKTLPHVDKRVAVLSDFATRTQLSNAELWAPLAELRNRSENCGIVRAQLEARRVSVSAACSSAKAASVRKLRLTKAKGTVPNPGGEQVAEVPLAAQAGTQLLELEVPEGVRDLDAFLSGSDALEQDDYAPVAHSESAMLIGVVADPATAAAEEGAPSVIEQALGALSATRTLDTGRHGEVRPLPLVPEDAKELEGYAALILDDPPGLTPESRSALDTWVRAGGFAVAFLGPNVEAARLGASFVPFAEGALTWEPTKASGVDGSNGFLGGAGASLKELAPRGRTRLAGAQIPEAEVLLSWDDGEPWLIRRRVEGGQVWTFGLPVGVGQSDLALRPGFLALLERFAHAAAQSHGQRVTLAGTPWQLDESTSRIQGPDGKTEPLTLRGSAEAQAASLPSPALRGRYRLLDKAGTAHERVVTVDEREVVSQPRRISSSQIGRAHV